MTRQPKSSSDGNRSVVPLAFHHFPRDYDQETYHRALTLIEETGNIARAHRTLKAELEAQGKPVPSYDTLWRWAEKSKDLIDKVRADKREEIVAVAGEVALAMAERLLETYEDLSPGQLPVAFGIAMDKRMAWDNAGRNGQQVNVQFNFYTEED